MQFTLAKMFGRNLSSKYFSRNLPCRRLRLREVAVRRARGMYPTFVPRHHSLSQSLCFLENQLLTKRFSLDRHRQLFRTKSKKVLRVTSKFFRCSASSEHSRTTSFRVSHHPTHRPRPILPVLSPPTHLQRNVSDDRSIPRPITSCTFPHLIRPASLVRDLLILGPGVAMLGSCVTQPLRGGG